MGAENHPIFVCVLLMVIVSSCALGQQPTQKKGEYTRSVESCLTIQYPAIAPILMVFVLPRELVFNIIVLHMRWPQSLQGS